jgi:hypothetical protein
MEVVRMLLSVFTRAGARTPAWRTFLAMVAFAPLVVVACGGKVIFVTDDGAGGTAATTGSKNGTSSGSGTPCLTTASVGGGPLGPNTAQGTKCFDWEDTKPCPATVAVADMIEPDPCYVLESVDDQCTSPEPDECCYDITESLACKG